MKKRHCRQCNDPLVQKKTESDLRFKARIYCNKKCRKDYNNFKAKLKGIA